MRQCDCIKDYWQKSGDRGGRGGDDRSGSGGVGSRGDRGGRGNMLIIDYNGSIIMTLIK